jgi:putative FmdB family regulatory protein
MPTYEYECKSCGHSFDVFQSMADDPLKICPQCGMEIRRVINGGNGVIFKGSGCYVTDNSRTSGGESGDKTPSTPPAKPAKAEGQAPCAGCAAAQSGACAQAVNS